MCHPPRQRRARLTSEERRRRLRDRREQKLVDRLTTDLRFRSRYAYRHGVRIHADLARECARSVVDGVGTTSSYREWREAHERWRVAREMKELAVALALAGFPFEPVAEALGISYNDVSTILLTHGEYRPWHCYRFTNREGLRIAARLGSHGAAEPSIAAFWRAYGEPARGEDNYCDDVMPERAAF